LYLLSDFISQADASACGSVVVQWKPVFTQVFEAGTEVEAAVPPARADLVVIGGGGIRSNQEQRARRLLDRIMHITASPSAQLVKG